MRTAQCTCLFDCISLTCQELLCRGSSRGEGGDDEDDDGEEVNRWNLRKCSAAGLDVLSTVFGDELLPIVLPIVEQKLRVSILTCNVNMAFSKPYSRGRTHLLRALW